METQAKNPSIPEHYQTIMPYLILDNAQKFIEFMKSVFGAIESLKVMRNEDCIQHAELRLSECTIMLADSTQQYLKNPGAFFIYVQDADAVYQKAIDHGSTILNEMADQEYGRSGGVLDPFGNTWWITSVH